MRMLYIDPAFFHDVFAQDLPAKQTAVMAAELRPSALSPAGDTLRCAGMEVDSFVVPRRPRGPRHPTGGRTSNGRARTRAHHRDPELPRSRDQSP
jgi:hypothetical protein